ncbi:MAG: DUF3040 domain-containing protein [Streptosporangiaceae bacterium]|jgi:hypothetical protein
MGMSRKERRILRRISKALRANDPRLAAKLEHSDNEAAADDKSPWAPGSHLRLFLF